MICDAQEIEYVGVWRAAEVSARAMRSSMAGVETRLRVVRVVWCWLCVSVGVLSLLGLVGCGGGGTSTSSTGAAPVTPATTHSAVTIPGRPAHEPQPPPQTSGSVVARSSRGAAGFRVQKGDNSIPDFGREARASQRQLAIAALAAFMRARAKGEWSKVCQHLARPTLRQLGSFARTSNGKLGGCAPALAALMTGPASERADTLRYGVAALRIEEKTAFALFYSPSGGKYVMPMQNEGGAWKMTQLAPLPYPLGTLAPAATR